MNGCVYHCDLSPTFSSLSGLLQTSMTDYRQQPIPVKLDIGPEDLRWLPRTYGDYLQYATVPVALAFALCVRVAKGYNQGLEKHLQCIIALEGFKNYTHKSICS